MLVRAVQIWPFKENSFLIIDNMDDTSGYMTTWNQSNKWKLNGPGWSKIEIWITHYTLNHSALQLSNETIFKKWFLNLFDFSRVIILNDLTKTSHLLTVVLQPKLFNSVPGTRNFGTYCTYHFSTVEINTKNHCDETFSEPRSEHSDAHDVSNILQSASIKQ